MAGHQLSDKLESEGMKIQGQIKDTKENILGQKLSCLAKSVLSKHSVPVVAQSLP